MAFSTPKYAIRRLVRGQDGTLQTIFVDPNTGQQISDPTGYHIIDNKGGNYNQNTGNGGGNNDDKNRDKPKETATDAVLNSGEHDGRSDSNLEAAARTGQPQTRTAGFGENYYNKPGMMGFAGFLPGIFGLAGTAANLGTNANNTAAVNNQRETLGFAEKSTMSNLGSTLMDKHGYVGDASYQDGQGNENVTPVSFESEDQSGRTALTPNEARMRNELNPTFQEASAAQVKNAQEAYENEFGTKGFLSSVGTAAKGLFSNLFGTSPTAPQGGVMGSQNQSSGGYTPSSFPAAPTAPQQSSTTIGGGLRDSNVGTKSSDTPSGVGLY